MNIKVVVVLASLVLVVGCINNTMRSNSGKVVMSHYRHAEYPVKDLFINRWSPRAMSGESLTQKELMSLFEAARWAPSSYNEQPWRFIYAHKGTEAFKKMFEVLVDFNQTWVKNASVLIMVLSKNDFEKNNKPNINHSFDTGAAWQNLALQAYENGLVAHGMSGFDFDKARTLLAIPATYTIESMIAIGKPANGNVLPEYMHDMEKPSDRKPLKEIVFENGLNL